MMGGKCVRNSKVLLMIGLTLLTIQGCSSKPEYQGYLSKEEVFKIDPEADLFEFDDHVYKGNIDWIEKEELTKNKKLGTIHTG